MLRTKRSVTVTALGGRSVDLPMLSILYLAHDITDPAVRRRIMMLQAGNAAVTLAGFRRSEEPVGSVAGVAPCDLGVTHDGRFAHRLAATCGAAIRLGATIKKFGEPDLIIARNLEMLALAGRVRAKFKTDIPIVYECLDIHRLLLREDRIGRFLRKTERLFARKVALVITSSPAFQRSYFRPRRQVDAPILLVENKVLDLTLQDDAHSHSTIIPAPGAPWRIGWFGALRCRKSLDLLSEFTRRMEGRFEVVLRGRPAYSEFDDFAAAVAAEPYIRFEGAYEYPGDLAGIYGQVHFTWAIDFFEEGLNSNWLLPNRLYEGCGFGAVPVALQKTETGRFLEERGIGLTMAQPSVESLCLSLGGITTKSYLKHRAAVLAEDRKTWICDRSECHQLVAHLKDAAGRHVEATNRRLVA